MANRNSTWSYNPGFTGAQDGPGWNPGGAIGGFIGSLTGNPFAAAAGSIFGNYLGQHGSNGPGGGVSGGGGGGSDGFYAGAEGIWNNVKPKNDSNKKSNQSGQSGGIYARNPKNRDRNIRVDRPVPTRGQKSWKGKRGKRGKWEAPRSLPEWQGLARHEQQKAKDARYNAAVARQKVARNEREFRQLARNAHPLLATAMWNHISRVNTQHYWNTGGRRPARETDRLLALNRQRHGETRRTYNPRINDEKFKVLKYRRDRLRAERENSLLPGKYRPDAQVKRDGTILVGTGHRRNKDIKSDKRARVQNKSSSRYSKRSSSKATTQRYKRSAQPTNSRYTSKRNKAQTSKSRRTAQKATTRYSKGRNNTRTSTRQNKKQLIKRSNRTNRGARNSFNQASLRRTNQKQKPRKQNRSPRRNTKWSRKRRR